SEVLQRLHRVISELVIPAWVGKPPRDVGLPKAGTLKADHWRTLFSIYLPLALLSLWHKDSPLKSNSAEKMPSVLETALHAGQSEKTMLYGFNTGASFRQWLLRPDSPPLLAYCLKLLDRTY
ncbi:hypothetical protein K435DRAFT_583790, partial [Dendrothele bispora CBS 962.96]